MRNVSAAVYNDDGWLTASHTPNAGCTCASTPPAGCSSFYETQYIIPGGGSTADEFGRVGTITDSVRWLCRSPHRGVPPQT